MDIGIIAGRGDLPISLALHARSVGLEPRIAIIDGFGDAADFQDFTAKVFKMGFVGKVLEFFKSAEVKNLVFAGKVDRPCWSDLRLDDMGRMLLFNILKNKLLGDDSLMNIIADFVQGQGFAIVAPADLMKSDEISMHTDSFPTQEDLLDIELGARAAKLLGQVDIGQAVVVENRHVLAVEGAEGTDALITRCKDLRTIHGPSAILVKALKPIQSIKLDPPAVGPDTIINLERCGFKGLALEKGGVIIIDRLKVLSLANQFKIFIYEYSAKV